MGEATDTFLEELGRRDHEPRLGNVRGTLRFELTGTGKPKPRLVTIDRGAVTVAHRRAHADAVVRVDGELLDRIVTGKANALTAMLRGDMTVEGDHELMVYFQRLLPAPPGARGS